MIAQIGAGGMGEVYRATDTNLGRQVAIKVLPDVFANDPERLARFEREAKTLAALNHPNIAQIHGLEKSDGIRALVMELVERTYTGGPHRARSYSSRRSVANREADRRSAGSRSRARHHPPGLEAREHQSATGWHGKGAGLRAGESAGASARHEVDGQPQSPTITSPAMMTGVGVLLGTAAYMSPEQARGKPVDKRADILGIRLCVLYEDAHRPTRVRGRGRGGDPGGSAETSDPDRE